MSWPQDDHMERSPRMWGCTSQANAYSQRCCLPPRRRRYSLEQFVVNHVNPIPPTHTGVSHAMPKLTD